MGSKTMKGWVYFLRFGADGPIKIGCSADPIGRALDLNVAAPVELVLLGALRSTNAKHEEAELHERLADCRIRGEWFEHAAVIGLMHKLRARIVAADELPVTGQRIVTSHEHTKNVLLKTTPRRKGRP